MDGDVLDLTPIVLILAVLVGVLGAGSLAAAVAVVESAEALVCLAYTDGSTDAVYACKGWSPPATPDPGGAP
ncbi:MAG: hypothetical protein CMD39_07375 [Gammaproteobacteria bacterium]|nr:hypothetical protein [Gammaproteobacteria bacterium]